MEKKVVNINEYKPEKKENIATEEEIALLFCGLVRLIRNSAVSEVGDTLRQECEFATQNYHEAIKVIKQKNEEIEKLKSINGTLNKKLNSIK
ncbi:MAG: hypothetical protein LBN07_01375 [Christensenellaceae bacterium]|nr:hypothetical protein [Christensenellaceae bacterium]